MAFWGEKFKRPDEEDIWAELKQMLTNSDAYEAQKKLKESQELKAFNKAWDKANGVGAIQPTQSEPYLKYEDLLSKEPLVLKGQVSYDKDVLKIRKIIQEAQFQYLKEHSFPNDTNQQKSGLQQTVAPLSMVVKLEKELPKKQKRKVVQHPEGGAMKVNPQSKSSSAMPLEPISQKTHPVNYALENDFGVTGSQSNLLTLYFDRIDKNPNLTSEEKFAKKKEVYEIMKQTIERNAKIERLNRIGHAKNIGNFMLDSAISTIPYGKIGGAVLKHIVPNALPKIANATTKLVDFAANKFSSRIPKRYTKDLFTGIGDDVLAGTINELKYSEEHEGFQPSNVLQKVVENRLTKGLKSVGKKVRVENAINSVSVPSALPVRQQRKFIDKAINYHNDYNSGAIVKSPDGNKFQLFDLKSGDITLNDAKVLPSLKSQIRSGNLSKKSKLLGNTSNALNSYPPPPKTFSTWLDDLRKRRKK